MPHPVHSPPLMPTIAPPLALPGSRAAPIRGGMAATVLLVEDSRHTAEVFRLVCRRAAVRLRRADCLAVARAHLRVYRPDVVVVDLGLPDGSGLDLILDLTTANPRPTRIIAISGDSHLQDAALGAGADLFLAKPLRLTGADRLDLALAEGGTNPDGGARPGGADPLALVDDLRHARRLIDAATGNAGGRSSGPDGTLGHAVQFARALAVSLGDTELLAASGTGDAAALRHALDGRLRGRGLL